MSSYERPQMWFFTAEELDAIAGGASNRSGDIGTSVETKLVNFENRIINVGVIGVEDNTLGNALANALAEKMLREDRINLLLQSLGSIALSNENSYELYHLLGNQVMPFVFETMTDFLETKNWLVNSMQEPFTQYAAFQGNGGPADNLEFGFTTMENNGCGIMATYNVLKYLSDNELVGEDSEDLFTDIREIGRYFMQHGAILWGTLGYFPSDILDYLNNEKFAGTVCMADIISGIGNYNYDEQFEGCPAGIILFWNNADSVADQVHYVMIHKSSANWQEHPVRAYNCTSTALYTNFDSISSLILNNPVGTAEQENSIIRMPICLIRIHIATEI